jgi:tRNA dimethylallyltransferase
MPNVKPKVLVIIGPTSSGKSDLAIRMAKKYNGEIISADSRQVYKGMDIGTGKVTKREQRMIKHHLLDIASPRKNYTVIHFQRDAARAIRDIVKRGKLPIICGGTGFWIEALLSSATFPNVPPNKALRGKLSKLSAERLFTMLQKKDPERAANIDKHNPVRLIRALEIIEATKKPVQKLVKNDAPYDAKIILLNPSQTKLYRQIEKRLKARLKQGMIAEVKRLRKSGVSNKRLIELGLEYRYITYYLQRKLTRKEMGEQLFSEIKKYAKRQMTWFKKLKVN